MSIEPQKKYADTVHLPKTQFPMKADLTHREPEMLKKWESEGLYSSIREKSKGKPKYILHDGPPYANGHTHIGHALNKILKDMIVKYYTMRGFDSLYVPGWDCHGLPIEHQCLKDMGKRKEEVERVEFRKQARKYAEKFVAIQREEFKRLGVFGEWDAPYLTMNYSYQASIADSFLKLYEKGFIEQRLKPVPWCFDCETALADAELEYADRTDQSVFVGFQISPNAVDFEGQPVCFLVWTTTPWTLPANIGLAVHPDLIYVFVKTDRGNLIFAESLLEILLPKLGIKEYKVIRREKGSKLEKWEAKHPFIERQSRVILADYVSATDGTGIVHIAPGHGEEDYVYGYIQNGLQILSPVDSRGRFLKDEKAKFVETYPEFERLHVFKANQKIIELLKEKGALLHEEPHQHSYPHCWRCKKPIIFRATPQWFLKVDHTDLRKKMGEAIQGNIQFTPDWGKNRIGSMVETRPDWCLSRQRYWGVPIPIIGCKNCAGKYFVSESKEKIVSFFEKEGADAWFSRPAGDSLPDGFKCDKCGGVEFKKEEDIIDVWFDSGVSHQAVIKKNPALQKNPAKPYQASLYLEGSDQHRGWFQSALTTAIALEGDPSFEGVLTHGFVVDGEGKKMSKSAGNVVSPEEVMKEFGADILRLWVSACDYQFDIRLSKEILKQLADSYRKIRNTFRYMLGNLHDFDPKKDRLPFEKLHPLDQWAVNGVDCLLPIIDQKYKQFDFLQIYQTIYNFCSIELSSYYFDILKDTLYTARKDSFLRRSAQTGLFEVLSRLTKFLAPILSFTMDEVWKSFPIEEGTKSVHESTFGETIERVLTPQLVDWKNIYQIRNAVMPALERKRAAGLIGSSLDAKIYVKTDSPELARILKDNWKELDRVFIVSQLFSMDTAREGAEEISVPLVPQMKQETLLISVEKADGAKCERCWHYSLKVGSIPEHPALCERCADALDLPLH
jgi:isoleucyl-tRNA synthetase